LEKLDYPLPNLFADGAEGTQAPGMSTFDGGRILEAPVEGAKRSEEQGAGLLGSVADRNDVVELLANVLVQSFRAVKGDIDTGFLHGLHCQLVQPDGIGSRAGRLIPIAGEMPKPPLSHLAAGRIAGTQE
jgi:hypothetical protein